VPANSGKSFFAFYHIYFIFVAPLVSNFNYSGIIVQPGFFFLFNWYRLSVPEHQFDFPAHLRFMHAFGHIYLRALT
jgi:hypothetical protein